MTHDFAKKKKPPAKKKKAAPKSRVPGWVWLFTGIVTGIFISFLGYLADITPEPEPPAAKARAKAQAKPAARAEEKSTTKFDFYTLLPEREVIVPDDPHDVEEQPTQAIIYLLQAGSFKSAQDADRLRAKLILMGLEAKVDAVTVNSGEQWHRVQVGPFHDRSKLSKARSMLISEGIDTLLMKKKG